MVELTRRYDFRAVHFIRYVEGPCAEVHGHLFSVYVTLRGEPDDVGYVVAPQELDEFQSLIDECYARKNLNEVPPFDYRNPTLENLTMWFYELAWSRWSDGVAVHCVRIVQDDEIEATYYGENNPLNQ